MPEVPVWIPEHVFISYSHNDSEVAQSVLSDLANADINTWIDERLEPGTPDWEREVRNAIARSYAVVVIASPHSLYSPYVRAEFSYSNPETCTVIPILVEGDERESIPMALAGTQHIDCRAERYPVGLTKLIQGLRKIKDDRSPQHHRLTHDYIENYKREYGVNPVLNRQDYIYIELANHDVVAMRYETYPTFNKLTDVLFMEYLQPQYRSLTYGEQWVLGTFTTDDNVLIQLLVPWSWLNHENRNLSLVRPIWSDFPPKRWFESSNLHHLQVLDRLPQFAFGIATNVDHAAQELKNHDPKTGFVLSERMLDLKLRHSGIERWFHHFVTVAERPEDINSQDYQHCFVVTSGRMDNSQEYVQLSDVSCAACIIQDQEPRRAQDMR